MKMTMKNEKFLKAYLKANILNGSTRDGQWGFAF
jgi:hypothetical protein